MRLKPTSPERVSGRLTISAARTNVVLLIRRTVRPSGIPVAVVCDHGAVVSTGFPSPDAGWVPAAPATWASGACHLLSQSNGGAAVGRTKRGITSFTCVRAAESVRRPGLARSSGKGRAHPLGKARYLRIRVSPYERPVDWPQGRFGES